MSYYPVHYFANREIAENLLEHCFSVGSDEWLEGFDSETGHHYLCSNKIDAYSTGDYYALEFASEELEGQFLDKVYYLTDITVVDCAAYHVIRGV